MKKIFTWVTIVGLIFAATQTAWANIGHGAHCLTVKGESKDCRVYIEATTGTVNMTFDDTKYQTDNLTVAGNQITEIATGEYAKKRMEESIAAGIVLGPLGALVGLFHKEKRTQIVITYNSSAGTQQITMIDIPTDNSADLIQELQQLTGLKIQSQTTEK